MRRKRKEVGRPRLEIDKEQFKKLCAIQCTEEEIAAWFKCSPDTIERWCKRELGMGFADAFKTFSADGKISLRRIQFKLAEKNTAMAIFLGKQYLGQKDYQEITTNTNDDETIKKMEQYFNAKRRDHGNAMGESD